MFSLLLVFLLALKSDAICHVTSQSLLSIRFIIIISKQQLILMVRFQLAWFSDGLTLFKIVLEDLNCEILIMG